MWGPFLLFIILVGIGIGVDYIWDDVWGWLKDKLGLGGRVAGKDVTEGPVLSLVSSALKAVICAATATAAAYVIANKGGFAVSGREGT